MGGNVLVCGGRDFDDWALIDETLQNSLEPGDTIIQGGAKGADFLAKVWAKFNGVPSREYPADWQAHGKAAGGIRNQKMLDDGRPVAVIAFRGGRGTGDMIRRAKTAGVVVHVID